MNTAQIFASLYLDKEVAEGTLKEYQPISIFGEVNTDQLSAYRPTHFRSLAPAVTPEPKCKPARRIVTAGGSPKLRPAYKHELVANIGVVKASYFTTITSPPLVLGF